jgi:hypothetical protein
MKTIASMRRPGGFSRSIDYLLSSLTSPDPSDEGAKPGAIVHLAQLMNVGIHQTELGDPDCGYFLAELLTYAWKRRSDLSDRNESFRKCFSRWESSRLATKRGSPLRRLIHKILIEAQAERRVQQITKSIPKARLVYKLDKMLLGLPEFSADPTAVSDWTEKIVYPRLRAMQSELAAAPVAGSLKKAFDINGKFQLSRLKPLVKETVARIAALPKAYYFDIS